MTIKKNVFAVLLFFAFIVMWAAENSGQPIGQWLQLGPVRVPAQEQELLKNPPAILDFNHLALSDLVPVTGARVIWGKGEYLSWQPVVNINHKAIETSILYLAAYLETSRFQETDLRLVKIDRDLPVAVFMDGQPVTATRTDDSLTAGLVLANGKHVLVLKILIPKGKELSCRGFLDSPPPFEKAPVIVSLDPAGRLTEAHILNVVNVDDIKVSPDGTRVAVFLQQTAKLSGDVTRWLEILDTGSGEAIFSDRNFGAISDFAWLKDSKGFSYSKTDRERTSVFSYNLSTHKQTCLLEGLANYSTYWWADDNSFLVYCLYEQRDENQGYRFIKDIRDRPAYSGTLFSYYIFFPDCRVTHQIAGPDRDIDDVIIAPDSKKTLLVKHVPDDRQRPYQKTALFLLDNSTYEVTKIIESNWLNTFYWSPDNQKILCLGGPSAFDGLGKNLATGKIPNDYETEAYILDPSNPARAEVISRGFHPSIEEASWGYSRQNIFFKAVDQADIAIYRYSPADKNIRKLDTGVDVVETVDFAPRAPVAVYWGSKANVPHKLFRMNLNSGNASLLKDYNKEAFRNVRIGKVAPFNFKTAEGKTIIGRLHYPVDFNPTQKYPCIVYYYGGTNPVENSFGGRYPFDWYAAHGYIVYILQPSGTIGFGQDFSAPHVNDWGKITSEEIIAGVQQLLKAHPYIDAQALGAMGASYGGFLTQYLATCSDNMFAAFISHAGISSLASYWGVGDWGYTYSGIATADSFPWNRKDIYVGQSPLFRAERIKSPLLLLHGEEDNNVPPGESYQMFAALKLLGKDVALVTFKGQSHRILEYGKRLHWMHTIIAWFDKYLKKQPQYWDHLYPEK